MAESGNIIDLASRRGTLGSEIKREATIYRAEVRTRSGADPEVAKREPTFAELYPAQETASSGLIHRALELLSECEARSAKAQSLLATDDVLGADLEITRLQSDLPELFCCKVLSDGLGAVILALHYALINREGAPLTVDQIFAVRRCIEILRNNPFLAFDESLDLIELLAGAELVVDPPEADTLSDLFAAE